MRISEEVLQEIKSVSVRLVIEKFVTVKKSGGTWKCSCPIHNEKSPSLVIKESGTDNFFKCFGCGASGDAIAFIQQYRKTTFPEACKEVAEIAGIDTKQNDSTSVSSNSINSKPKTTFKSPTKKPIQQVVKSYSKPKTNATKPKEEVLKILKDRGISEAVSTKARISQSTEYFGQLKKETTSINFNYFRDNDLVNTKNRSLEAKAFGLGKDCELIPYNMDNVSDNVKNTLVVTEGEFDCLAIMEAFHQDNESTIDVISVPNGASSGKNQNLKYLDCPKAQKIFKILK